MKRVFNFSAGPSMMPQEVLEQARDELLDWGGLGVSVMEMSHRSSAFGEILALAQQRVRSLLNVPEHYHVLFVQGGAVTQNAAVPLNLLGDDQRLAFIDTGSWSHKTIQEARKYAEVDVIASNAQPGSCSEVVWPARCYIPEYDLNHIQPQTAYLHICGNETIDGVEYFDWPDFGSVTGAQPVLVCDASSHIMSRPMDVQSFGLIYAGAQKNMGPAGLTLVLVREDLLDRAHRLTPSALCYQNVARANSMYNTPATFGIYMAGLMMAWMERQGGIEAIEQRNIQKSALLYQAIDESSLYVNRVDQKCRSRMNIPFQLREPSLDAVFLHQAHERGLVQLKGHKSVGGMRASIYNAMPIEGVQQLVEFMREFEKAH